ncbi:hypothetical protein [Mycobacteroides abscessus]|uniref:hypothetical protein n=1 Tax=Mycobacteroides abscessus TaxID=36809 RepID=UPI0009415701|nr:hypothetical protein [Mycobacteroides abscessus]
MAKKQETNKPQPPRAWRRGALVFWWAVLLVSAAMSAYGNVRHAEMVAPAEHLTVARFIAGALPLALLVMVEGIAVGTRGGAAGRPHTIGLSIIVPIAAVVLASSYVGLLSLVQATGLFAPPTDAGSVSVGLLNYGLAAVPDLLMIASTVYVMSLRSASEPAARAAAPTAWSRIGGNLLSRAEQITAPKKPQVESMDRENRADVDQATRAAVQAPTDQADRIEPVRANRPADRTPSVREERAVAQVHPSDGHRTKAARLIAEGRTNHPTETVARVLAAADEGMSKRGIEAATGVSASTAARIVAAAKELTDQQQEPSRVLAAV